MAHYQIEQGIPIPELTGSASRKAGKNIAAVTMGKMQIGDSVTIPEHQRPSWKICASILKNATGKVFITRQEFDGVIRIWRIK